MDLSEFQGISLPGFDPREISEATALSGGGNNRVFRLRFRSGEQRVLKFYFRHQGDPRDRLGAEFGAMNFLWRQGVRSIPQPFGCDTARGCALYAFVEGSTFSPPATLDDVNQALAFTAKLASLRTQPEAAGLPLASEACVCWSEVLEGISARVARVRAALPEAGELQGPLLSFLEGAFEDSWRELVGFVDTRRLSDPGLSEDRIPASYRTLSPSDFSFHNAIRVLSGKWIFQDFEYFGWDDPSKLIADFMLHPAARLDSELQGVFCREALKVFGSDAGLRSRLAIAYPLFGLKWCMVLLNEFVPTSRSRRRFAAGSQTEAECRRSQRRQLEKAGQLLTMVRSNYGKFASSL